ncbi:nuclease-related domain-containing protein [Kineococcus sp. GCM10028916]|uniref:nuclease-related domain-containing protein n=1 Tax=Kineococcus sp. GCM10028916 TaxID=3273394 RepID=UPI00362A9E04
MATTTAGAGADEQARRVAARLERLHQEPASEESLARVAAAERRHHVWTAGAEGERLVVVTLTELEAEGWVVLHDVHWPGRPKANLDHVAIGPGGVVVVDAKNWSGQVSVRDGLLRNDSWRKDRELEVIASAVAAVSALLEPAVRSSTSGLLCLVAQEQEPQRTTSGITVVGRSELVAFLRGLEVRLEPRAVQRTAAFLRATLDSTRNPVLTTTGALPTVPSGRAVRTNHRRPVARRARRPLPWPRRLLLVLLTLVVAGLIGFLAVVLGLAVVQQMTNGLVHPSAASAP